MSVSPSLKEYRCVCGKLLFKGEALTSILEIKCKRCGNVRTYGDVSRGAYSFMLVVNTEAEIVDACEGVAALGYSREYVIGKLLTEILPLAKDGEYQEILKRSPKRTDNYRLCSNTLILRDHQVPLESHVVPVGDKNEQFYRVFNVIKGV